MGWGNRKYDCPKTTSDGFSSSMSALALFTSMFIRSASKGKYRFFTLTKGGYPSPLMPGYPPFEGFAERIDPPGFVRVEIIIMSAICPDNGLRLAQSAP